MLVGLSTAEQIDPDPFARRRWIRTWRQRPDFVSVDFSELGSDGLGSGAPRCIPGVGIEAGLSTPADAEQLARSPFAHQLIRALAEVDDGPEDPRAVAQLIPAGIPQPWHGVGPWTWEVFAAGAAAGVEVRVGLQDVLVVPDGRVAAGNAELVAAALELVGN